MSSKKPEPFNNPFAKLQTASKNEQKAAAKKPVAPPAVRAPASKKLSTDEEDAALFLESVGGIAPVKRLTQPSAPQVAAAQASNRTEEAESLARLAELVAADERFEVSDDGAFVEGSITGFDERVLRKLRAGDFTPEAQLDLHGRTADEAKLATETFIQKSKVAGLRCVLIVTGKGLRSPDQPVLKPSLPAWLTRGRCARQVLAFCSARAKDGGDGAVYVMLRR
jgi:DNA-nicking Smr family endonuclease